MQVCLRVMSMGGPENWKVLVTLNLFYRQRQPMVVETRFNF